ncbi:MAG: RNA methyltransferase [Bacteroidales bacterium]|nr:RNA methyltransferase [Bacteroidales bacterium]
MERISKTKIARLSALDKKKMREKTGLFSVEGTKAVCDMLEGDFSLRYIVASSQWWQARGNSLSLPSHAKSYEATSEDMKKLSLLSTPSDVIAYFSFSEENDIPKPDFDSLILMLDGIQDPGNLGTIIRTADWFGIKTIYASYDTVDVYNPKTVMATMGSLARVKVKYCELKDIIAMGDSLPVYGTLLEGKNIYQSHLNPKGFLIMGNEGKGLSAGIRSLVTDPLLIPPVSKSSHPESLNVGVATAIALSEFFRPILKLEHK